MSEQAERQEGVPKEEGRIILREDQSMPELVGQPSSRRNSKATQHKVIRYSKGAGEGAYREVIHASPTKIATIQKLLGSEKQCNLDVKPVISRNRIFHLRNERNSSDSCRTRTQV